MVSTGSATDQQPFSVRLSTNVEEFVFSEHWDHRRHYHAVFNSQYDLLPRHMPQDAPWAMLADWRRWLAQTPADERLCIRCIDKFVSKGMTHYALVCDEHPVAKWQAERVRQANPSLICRLFDSFDAAYLWLENEGYDLNFENVAFKQDWLNPSDAFDNIVEELSADPNKFVTKPAAQLGFSSNTRARRASVDENEAFRNGHFSSCVKLL